MKTLIIFTNPKIESLNGAFLKSVLKGLENNHQPNEIQVLDLYKDEFNPVLTYGGEKRRRDMHTDPAFEEYREQIKWAERLVFIYPIWWGRPPAMLLGYFDQMMASNFAYKDVPGKIYPEGLLRGKEAICISTMKGPTAYPLLTLGDSHKKLMKSAVLNFVGIKKVKIFEFGNMESPNGKQAEKLNRIENYFNKLK
jgi:NAD(P)H dehydrogenase (quinone)